jgi:hypothetical protein
MYKIKQIIKNNLVILLYFYLFLSSSISYSIVYNYLWKTNKILEPSWITAHNKYGVKELPSWVTAFIIAIFVLYSSSQICKTTKIKGLRNFKI